MSLGNKIQSLTKVVHNVSTPSNPVPRCCERRRLFSVRRRNWRYKPDPTEAACPDVQRQCYLFAIHPHLRRVGLRRRLWQRPGQSSSRQSCRYWFRPNTVIEI